MKRALVIALAVLTASGAATHACGRERDRPTPSGLPVPRWVSLKFDEVRARSGPGDDYGVVWVYRVRRLPVQIVEETREWRKICDPDGGSAWVRKSALDSRRTLFRAAKEDLVLRKAPHADAQAAAQLRAKSIVDLDRAEGDWRRVKVDGIAGWAQASQLWGAVETQACR
jgi:SH3-like domain-containing protein